MGASGWHHFVPWDSDVQGALDRLRDDVFEARRYHLGALKRLRRPKTIADAVRIAGESGTHSVLDVHRVVETPHPPSQVEWAMNNAARGHELSPEEQLARMEAALKLYGTVAPIRPERQHEIFGDVPLTRSNVETRVLEISQFLERGTAVWLAVTDEQGTPQELLFIGKTGD